MTLIVAIFVFKITMLYHEMNRKPPNHGFYKEMDMGGCHYKALAGLTLMWLLSFIFSHLQQVMPN